MESVFVKGVINKIKMVLVKGVSGIKGIVILVVLKIR